jgi:hypothetical protein
VFFLDDHVFPEADGFWVKGAQSADMVIAWDDPGRPVELRLANGTAPNAVVIEIAGIQKTMTLAASEVRRWEVPLSGARTAAVRITSPAGFRPSDAGGADSRFLGVRVSD